MRKIINNLAKKQWIIWGALLLIALFFVMNRELITLLFDGNIEAVQSFLKKNMGYALFFLFLVMLIQNSFTIFPLILVITINITLFGFVNGFLWSWLTSILASLIVYYSVRYIFQETIMEKFHPKVIEELDTNGFAYVFQARIFPFVPTSLVNILAGLSTIRVLPYLLATTIGNFLYFFVLALIPAGILSADWNEYVIWIIIVAAILLYYLIKKKRKSIKDIDTID
ncbi:TVP38/TMEM64 family protein [Psychrobacillus glaciei]|uniref:TVP38/TMEM64 family membrane protein n=1 Tax=Psychrobacillus glaciei TaxID=2283160 RepID=A0A5J6SIV8_9BACI|nr:VTT domain-containing protein [Psychrobacillus glaciei]QFF97768.1 TVP38/TMEM64 family protein [Psychrobacillus glaciei]